MACLALQSCGVQIDPMTGDINCDAHLEKEHVTWVQIGQSYQEASRSTAISELIQHSTKLGPLIEFPCKVAIKRVQERTDDVAPTGNNVVGWHKNKCHDRKNDPCVANKIRHEQKDVLLGLHVSQTEI